MSWLTQMLVQLKNTPHVGLVIFFVFRIHRVELT